MTAEIITEINLHLLKL